MKQGYYAAFQNFFDQVLNPDKQALPPSQKRTDIEAAALTLFAERGFAATTTAAIAAQAKTTEKTLFKYFPSKDDLIVAVCLDAVVANLSGQYLDTYLATLEPKEALTGFLTDKTAACLAGRDGFKLFLQAILMDQDLRNALIQVITEQYHPQTDAAVAQLGTRLNNPDLDPFTFNLFLFSILIGYDLMRTVLAPDWDTNDTDNINRITDALLHGFAR